MSDLPSTSSNFNTFSSTFCSKKQQENSKIEDINLPLLFRQFELQFSPISNYVSLYNAGLYDEINIYRPSLNYFGAADRFTGRVRHSFLNKFLTRIWPNNNQKFVENKIVSKFIHLTPHKHSSLLHHVILHEDLPYFPIIYFVAVQHSGYSISPIKEEKIILKKYQNFFCNKIKENSLFFSVTYSSLPRGICFDPLRLEKSKELPTIALYSLCSYRAKKWRDDAKGAGGRITWRMLLTCLKMPIISTFKSSSNIGLVKVQESSKQIILNEKAENFSQKMIINVFLRDQKSEFIKSCPTEEKILSKSSESKEKDASKKRQKFTALIILKNHTPKEFDLTKKDKKEDKKEKKKKGKEKKGEKSKKIQTAGTSSASTSSSSSSSTDAEAEEVHIISGERQHTLNKKIEPPPTSQNQTTLETCHEEIIGPEQVTTEIDADGNIIKRVVRTEQIRHTVQSHSVQSVPVEENNTIENSTSNVSQLHPISNGHRLSGTNAESTTPDELVSSKVVTTGNRTVETLTYKTEKDGIIETRVEHRITIHSNEEIDHDSELSKAILEATNMNPELKVEKVEVSKK